MSEQTPQPDPIDTTPPAAPPPQPPPAYAAPAPRPRLRDHTVGFPALCAVAAGAVLFGGLVGGLVGGVVGYAVHDDGPEADIHRIGPGRSFEELPESRMPRLPNPPGPDDSED
jgi:hypothetical protein